MCVHAGVLNTQYHVYALCSTVRLYTLLTSCAVCIAGDRVRWGAQKAAYEEACRGVNAYRRVGAL